MCNLYQLTKSAAELASLCNVEGGTNANTSSYIYPAANGLVIESGKVRSMVWGFPLQMISKKTGKPLKPKPVNNCRTDKFDSRFWNASFRERRCLIPVSAFAEAEGQKGKMTRTWMTLPDSEIMLCAGVWRDSSEWGPVYSMIMTDANEQMASVHNRMPVILPEESRGQFLSGSEAEAMAVCLTFYGNLSIDRTQDLWFKRD